MSAPLPPPPPPPPTPPEALDATPAADAPPPPGNERVVVERVSKWFGDVVAVSDVSFVVWPGVTALLGPNGAGKSTMLRMLAGLTTPSQGAVSIMGADPRVDTAVRGRIGIVPQQEQLFAERSSSSPSQPG